MLHIKRPHLGGADNHKIGVGVNAWGPSLPAAYGTPTEAHLVRKKLKAPFPYFGGKSKVAPLVWNRFGDVDNFIEPFVGSGAVLLARPSPPRVETINDLDCYVCNVWRSLKYDPDGVAVWADDVVSEADLHARHRWLVGVERPDPVVPGRFADDPLAREAYLAGFLGEERTYAAAFRQKVRTDPHYYDVKLAGWYLWGMCAWIGSGWCASPDALVEQRPVISGPGQGTMYGRGVHAKGERPHEWQQVPFIGGHKGQVGVGIHAGRPQLADAYSRGRGVHGTDAADRYLSEQIPEIGGGAHGASHRGINGVTGGGTCASRRAWLLDWFSRLRDRLRTVRVCSGHWLRVCDSESVTTRLGMTGLFLDPPYRHALKGGEKNRDSGLYGSDGTHSDQLVDEVIAYCLERGDSPQMRIAVCGYEGEGYEALVEKGWECVAWSSQGGYANRNKKNRNRDRERIFFSPFCVKPDLGLFRDFA